MSLRRFHPAPADSHIHRQAIAPVGCPICDNPSVMLERQVGLFHFFRCTRCAFLWALACAMAPLIEVSS
jgi:hypothetical protein